MNRRIALAVTSGLLVLGTAALVTPSAAAYPVRYFSPPCPGQSTVSTVDLLGARYARYLSTEDLRSSDENGNGALCVIRLSVDTASGPSAIDAPIMFMDDSGQ